MKCKQCGNKIVPGASFCGKCGSIIETAKNKTNKDKQSNSWYASLCVCLGVLLLYYMIGLYCVDGSGLGEYVGIPFDYDISTLLVCMCWRMYEISAVVIALSYIQIRLRYIHKKRNTLKVSKLTRIAGIFAILASIGGLAGVIIWFFCCDRFPIHYTFGFYLAFGLYAIGCVMTLICGITTLFTRGTGQKREPSNNQFVLDQRADANAQNLQ